MQLPPYDLAQPPLAPRPPVGSSDISPLPTPALTRWQRFPSTPWLWGCLVALTALGGFLRFWRLGYQAYWTDEAYTLWRVDGTFDDLLRSLTTEQGFPPGWYTLLRLWCNFVAWFTHSDAYAYSPEATRMLPALFGTLTVPAFYFLARQFTDRKGALLVMLLAAVNPFLIYYSRDIKMYQGLWFFAVLNMAIFFQWQTSHRHLLWFPLFALTGALMTSMHAMAWFLILLQLIFLLTRPRPRPFDAPLWLLGAATMSILPIYWYFERSTWLQRITNDADRGMEWIQKYTDMSWQTLAGLPTSHILGYLWPVYPPDERLRTWFMLGTDFNDHLAARSRPWLAHAELYVAVTVGALMFLGLIPWRGIRRSPERENSVTRGRGWWLALWIILPTLVLACTWIPPDSEWFERVWRGFNPKPIWEPRYLGIILPAWLLWLAASLRRLPTWPLRTLAILFVAGVCTFSALSNQLMLRNAPFNRTAAVVAKYYDRNNPSWDLPLAVAVPEVAYPREAKDAAIPAGLGIKPGSPQDDYHGSSWTDLPPPQNFIQRSDQFSLGYTILWLRNVSTQSRIKTIILTDRYGEMEDPKDRLSNESIQETLGPQWKRVYEEKYAWHYEWRFYLFHTWRTRVWTRSEPRPEVPDGGR